MDLTLPFNALMWVTGLAAIALSLNSVWTVLRAKYNVPFDGLFSSKESRTTVLSLSIEQRVEALKDIQAIQANLQSVEAALDDIGRIERELRRSEKASSAEITIALRALLKLRKFDRTAKVAVTQLEEILSRPQ
jgi:hypothetical protein